MSKIRESHPLLKPAFSCYTMLYLNNNTVELDHCKLFHVEDYCTRHTLWYNTQIEKQTSASCRLGYQAHLHSWKSRVRKGGARSTNGPVTRRVGWQIRQGWSVKSGALMSLKVPRWKNTGLEALYQPKPTKPILGGMGWDGMGYTVGKVWVCPLIPQESTMERSCMSITHVKFWEVYEVECKLFHI